MSFPHTPGAMLGAGREADVYSDGDAAVLKLYRPGFGGHRTESMALRSLEDHGVAPRLVDILDCDGELLAKLRESGYEVTCDDEIINVLDGRGFRSRLRPAAGPQRVAGKASQGRVSAKA